MADTTAECAWTTVTVSGLLRDVVRRSLRTAAFDAMHRNPGLKVDIDEDHGSLESELRIAATGPGAVAFMDGIRAWLQPLESPP